MNIVRKSSIFITENSTYVHISQDICKSTAIFLFSEYIDGNLLNPTDPASPLIPTLEEYGEEYMVNWIFFLDTLNFNYMYDDGSGYVVEYPENSGVFYRGYWGHLAAMKRAKEENIPFLSALWMKNCTTNDIKRMYRHSDKYPLLTCPVPELRRDALNEAGEFLLTFEKNFLSTSSSPSSSSSFSTPSSTSPLSSTGFLSVVRHCQYSAEKLSSFIGTHLSSYADIGFFPTRKKKMESDYDNGNEKIEIGILDDNTSDIASIPEWYWNEPYIPSKEKQGEPVFFYKRAQYILCGDLGYYVYGGDEKFKINHDCVQNILFQEKKDVNIISCSDNVNDSREKSKSSPICFFCSKKIDEGNNNNNGGTGDYSLNACSLPLSYLPFPFADLPFLTMFADYRVPQVLAYKGILVYEKPLLKFLNGESDASSSSCSCLLSSSTSLVSSSSLSPYLSPFLQSKSLLEMEIRGCSIAAVGRITDFLKEKIRDDRKLIKEKEKNKEITVEKESERKKERKNGQNLLYEEDDLIFESELNQSITDVAIDYYLWLWGKKYVDEMNKVVKPHRIKGWFY